MPRVVPWSVMKPRHKQRGYSPARWTKRTLPPGIIFFVVLLYGTCRHTRARTRLSQQQMMWPTTTAAGTLAVQQREKSQTFHPCHMFRCRRDFTHATCTCAADRDAAAWQWTSREELPLGETNQRIVTGNSTEIGFPRAGEPRRTCTSY